ncbi:phosphoinositide 3-kinase adapter protein 1 isoform X2 [Clupea harengus]|uniref:Phosphoinositide 3-kinase adapter protein 1 isoform X2 n=1 Tax=Clupea harengus TaxID=7950 RepID=A0A6P8G462_CLUHA|nr:phosphoinositide 3-kinase adapter protein 1 isoform X2 [Clupea harengus]
MPGPLTDIISACKMSEVAILHTSEAAEWASYLQTIFQASHNFPKNSVVLHLVDSEAPQEDLDLRALSDSKCILLLLSAVFLDLLSEPVVNETFQKLLCPPHTVVVFFCAVSEDDVGSDNFEHWDSWKKLHAEDEPSFYVSTVMESIANASKDIRQTQEEYWPEPPVLDEEFPPPCTEHAALLSDPSPEPPIYEDDIVLSPLDKSQDICFIPQACVTVQPERIPCGENVTVYIIMLNKLGNQENVEMEFSGKDTSKRVPGKFVNEYTINGLSPDMPAGEVTLTLYCNNSVICSKCLTYFTPMDEINSQLEKATDPLQFMCQAFNITCNTTEPLDNLLTESLKSRMPANGLHVFGISQLEQEPVSVSQRDRELPTLLHFAAKYGLKRLMIVLLQCPGALQAYSVANKHGEYPNNLAEKNGFSALRQFMDDYVETADTTNTDVQDSPSEPLDESVYEHMTKSPQEMEMDSLEGDIYESMRELGECAEDLYEDMETATKESQNQEDTLLRKFFQVRAGQPLGLNCMTDGHHPKEGEGEADFYEEEEEEDPYNACFNEQIYDTVEDLTSPEIINRPPAPIPRPMGTLDMQENKTYISRVFSEKESTYSQCNRRDSVPPQVQPRKERLLSSAHDPYAGMKTPGQRQLIALQERVKVGSLTVDEAVQEFKAWKFDQDKRSCSVRFQQDNLQKLRDSITRRHKEKGKSSLEDLEITSPMQRDLQWSRDVSVECAIYDPSPRTPAPPPPVTQTMQRGTWQTGSTSSNSSSESNRLSTLSTLSSGTEGEFEDVPDLGPLPPLPPRYGDDPPLLPPPRLPRRIPERIPENMLHERYIQSPSRTLTQPPPQRPIPPPPIPRRIH